MNSSTTDSNVIDLWTSDSNVSPSGVQNDTDYFEMFRFDGENPDFYDELMGGLCRSLRPIGRFEEELVAQICQAMVKKKRLDIWEQQNYNHYRQSSNPAWLNISEQPSLINMHAKLERQIHQLWDTLKEVQKTRANSFEIVIDDFQTNQNY